jgi:plasmid stabilization system protein ParE
MVKWTLPARDDLKAIYEYIALDSNFYAKKIIREIIAASATISNMPERGRMVPETDEQDIRELFIYSYRLIYQLSSDSISILAVIHGSRNISENDIHKNQA